MYERCLLEAERFLASHKNIVVPVQETWEEVVKQSKHQQFEVPSLADFTAMLEGDARFEIISPERAPEDPQGSLFEDEAGEGDMVQLGFFSEDRVKLRRVKLPPEEEEEIATKSIVKGIGATIKTHTLRVKSNHSPQTSIRKKLPTNGKVVSRKSRVAARKRKKVSPPRRVKKSARRRARR